MKKLAFVETEATNNETIEKLKIVNDIRRHIFEDDNAYTAYKELAEKFNEFETTAKELDKANKEAEKIEKNNNKNERKAQKYLDRIVIETEEA